jgi:hypothetical protein
MLDPRPVDTWNVMLVEVFLLLNASNNLEEGLAKLTELFALAKKRLCGLSAPL